MVTAHALIPCSRFFAAAVECRFVSLTFGMGNITSPSFSLSAWRVNYPWVDSESSFTSSNATLNAVYDLCRYTLYSAAIDTYTDSNTVGLAGRGAFHTPRLIYPLIPCSASAHRTRLTA